MLVEVSDSVPFPIRYVFLDDAEKGFHVLLYHECTLGGPGSGRDGNSDTFWGIWYPDRGVVPFTHLFVILKKAGMLPHVDAKCREGFDAWQTAEG